MQKNLFNRQFTLMTIILLLLLGCKQNSSLTENPPVSIETETSSVSVAQNQPTVTITQQVPPTDTPVQPTIEPNQTNTPTPTNTLALPTVEIVQIEIITTSVQINENLDSRVTATPSKELVIEAESIKVNNFLFDFSVFADGKVVLDSGEEFYITPAEVDDLISDLHIYLIHLHVAYDLDLIQKDDCNSCPRINFYNSIYDKFYNFMIGHDVQTSQLLTEDEQHRIQTSAIYTHNIMRLFLERILDASPQSDHVFTVKFYEDGVLDDTISFSAYPDGTVVLSTGEERNALVDQIQQLENRINSFVFIDVSWRTNEFRYQTTDCTDCFQITFFNWGDYRSTTIEGDLLEENGSHAKASVIVEIELFYFRNIE
ncbi:MAG: hypothetical protein GY943_17635 [Chloroflexi bacterium]|nr:hypothetical protein [Chloroflexota bacterium]